jgi:hypothetical protein
MPLQFTLMKVLCQHSTMLRELNIIRKTKMKAKKEPKAKDAIVLYKKV